MVGLRQPDGQLTVRGSMPVCERLLIVAWAERKESWGVLRRKACDTSEGLALRGLSASVVNVAEDLQAKKGKHCTKQMLRRIQVDDVKSRHQQEFQARSCSGLGPPSNKCTRRFFKGITALSPIIM